MASLDLLSWLREQCSEYRFDVRALYRSRPDDDRPLTAVGPAELDHILDERGHFMPLPKEPAALANIVEVSICDYLVQAAESADGLVVARGTERGYPDLEFAGPALGGAFHAVDVKVARRRPSKRGTSTQTQSRITLYTGNTYFRYPQLQWPGTFRPFEDYGLHLDVLCIYDLSEESQARVSDLEVIVQEAWRIASKQRSSTTREYLGAVLSIEALREGNGEFATAEAFYAYWRKYNFRVGKVVQQQLDKLLREAKGPRSA